MSRLLCALAAVVVLTSCERATVFEQAVDPVDPIGVLNLPDGYYNYAHQSVPDYIRRENTPDLNPITDAGATLGRVLFYDTQLSANNRVSCASCHQQSAAFSDLSTQSTGLTGGLTGRHSMRLVNARFSQEARFFWDERASSLEEQTTQPIQDHIEMGFSGTNGQPDIDDLVKRLEDLDYYDNLFESVFGDQEVNEDRMQSAIAQFIRSIQSFDSKFDEGLSLSGGNINRNFPNYTAEENLGKQLFLMPPGAGGAGCAGCHRPPEFDIDPNTRNNGVVGAFTDEKDLDVTRSPSLRNVTRTDGTLNGPLMHDGSLFTLAEVIDHYDEVVMDTENTNLDPRLMGPPGPTNQVLNLTAQEKDALVAFLVTLAGEDVYTDVRWSDPFR